MHALLTSVTYIHRFVALFVCSSSDRAQPCSQVVGTNMRKLHSFQVCSHFWYIFGVARRLSKGVNPQVLSPVCLFQDGKQAGRCTGSKALAVSTTSLLSHVPVGACFCPPGDWCFERAACAFKAHGPKAGIAERLALYLSYR